MGRDYDDYYYDDINVKEISHVYEMRHSCNVHGLDYVAKELRCDPQRLVSIYDSNVHGSTSLRQFFSCSDEKFSELIESFERKEEERQDKIAEIAEKNERLVDALKEKRKNFAGIGTNKAKRRLNKLSENDNVAKAVRVALEIEDKNILAKDSYGKYRDKIYDVKYALILKLCDIFKTSEWCYGIQYIDSRDTTHIIYFEIPGCEQISWHFSPENKNQYPVYTREWDKKENSTLFKLEVVSLDILRDWDKK